MKRAMVIRRWGDPEIAGVLVSALAANHKPIQCDAVRRVAMHQHTPEEWDAMTAKARYDYGYNPHHGKVIAALIGIIGLLILSIAEWFAYFDEWNRS